MSSQESKPEYVPPPPPVRDQFTAEKPKPKWFGCLNINILRGWKMAEAKPEYVPPPPPVLEQRGLK